MDTVRINIIKIFIIKRSVKRNNIQFTNYYKLQVVTMKQFIN